MMFEGTRRTAVARILGIAAVLAATGLTIGVSTLPLRAQDRGAHDPAHAGGPHAGGAARPAVIELFTSQGCSSCPPADRLMGQMSERRDVIVLSFPVDIWDYIGWKDTLAKPEFTTRQRVYAASRGDHQVYTPQAVVDGAQHVVGSDKGKILQLVEGDAPWRATHGASMAVRENDGMVVVEIGEARGDVGKGGGVWLLRVERSKTVSIGRGENSGRKVTYSNVVRSVARMGYWTGAAARLELPLSEARGEGTDGYVVLVQKNHGGRLGPILAAAKSSNL